MHFLLRLFVRIITLMILTILCLYVFIFLSGKPDFNNLNTLTMYDDAGEIFYQKGMHPGNSIALQDVSPSFLKAIVSIEDHHFYSHHGFDYIGMLRAMKTNILSGRLKQGASTISQQTARLLYLSNEKTWSRKIKEAYYTMVLETHLTKDEILEQYINTLYFGHGVYGIKDAAKYYFNKSPADLTLNESALLAGVVNGPTYFSPLNDKIRALERRNIVLKAMANEGYLSLEDYQFQKDKAIHLSSTHQIKSNSSIDYYRDYILQQLDALNINNQKSLKIYTSLHQSYQDELNKLIQKTDASNTLQCAFVVTNPKNNQVQALIGGKDYSQSQFNRATHASRQIGSTIKPFLYYLALENGFTPSTTFSCSPTTFKLEDGTNYAPHNFNNRYAYKDITLAQAIAVSDNIFAVKTHLFLGTKTLSSFLNHFGLKNQNNASLALGTIQTNILQLTDMYNALAYKGRYQQAYGILRIEDIDGHIVYQHYDKQTQKLNPESCLILAQLLKGTFDASFSTYLHATMENYPLKNFACKTGSTDYDNLLVAYNKDIVVGGWSGFDTHQKIEETKDKQFIKQITYQFLKDKKYHWYSPENIKVQKINLDGQVDEQGLVYYFKKE